MNIFCRQIAEVQLRRLGPIKSIEKLWLTQADDLKWIAGRCESCDLQINSAYASRKHFLITYKHDKYFISDTGVSIILCCHSKIGKFLKYYTLNHFF